MIVAETSLADDMSCDVFNILWNILWHISTEYSMSHTNAWLEAGPWTQLALARWQGKENAVAPGTKCGTPTNSTNSASFDHMVQSGLADTSLGMDTSDFTAIQSVWISNDAMKMASPGTTYIGNNKIVMLHQEQHLYFPIHA
ncbi:hypothetical protein ACRALDRAFT_206783 [Sodiomyces alcalophilus JCM 7366]|uniref:uncharacterized protein n=1 Tax=Sodiomyces alcalophilus JCM 7366 TaxID=591952 RepID=UPI0039B42205